MKVGVIVNHKAGSSSDYPEEKVLKELLEKYELDADVFYVKGSVLKEKLEELVENKYNIIAVAGGDGTISSAVNILSGSNIPLAVIPAGTLNHFAKDSGIHLELEDAVKILSEGNISKVDTAEVNGRIFINNSSIGLYPKVVRHRDQQLERLGGSKWITMVKAFINVFRRFSLSRVTIQSNDKVDHCKTPMVFIGNNEYHMNLLNIGTRTKINKGVLSLYYINAQSKFALLKYVFLVLLNRLDQGKNFNFSLCKEVIIESNKKTLDIAVDGEVIHLNSPLHYKIRPKDLLLITPKEEQ